MKIKLGAGNLTMSDIAGYTGGVCVGQPDASFEYLCTDSREAGRDTLFVAMRGQRVDGHSYISVAYDSGCRCFLVEDKSYVPDNASAVAVADSARALVKMAEIYKSRVDCLRIGITGSVGKTTTKEFVAAVVSQAYLTHKTFGNYNSTIGMPLTLMETPECTQVSVIEMAMSGLGEISQMSLAAQPNITVISNIGSSHMEALGSKDNILKAKLEILDGLASDGYVIINGDDKLLNNQKYPDGNVIRVGIQNSFADYVAYNIRIQDKHTVFDVKCKDFTWLDIKIPVIGEHNVYAALIAIAVSGIIGMDEDAVRRGLSSYVNAGLRQNIIDVGGITVIEDCYNASPESMRAAIRVLRSLKRPDGRCTALLGDMLELGQQSNEFHSDIGEFVAEHNVELLFTIGNLSTHIADGAIRHGMKSENVFVNSDSQNYKRTAQDIWQQLRPGDVLLVKASRGIRAERVVEQLKVLAVADNK